MNTLSTRFGSNELSLLHIHLFMWRIYFQLTWRISFGSFELMVDKERCQISFNSRLLFTLPETQLSALVSDERVVHACADASRWMHRLSQHSCKSSVRKYHFQHVVMVMFWEGLVLAPKKISDICLELFPHSISEHPCFILVLFLPFSFSRHKFLLLAAVFQTIPESYTLKILLLNNNGLTFSKLTSLFVL